MKTIILWEVYILLQLMNIRKVYKTDAFEQVALADINLSFRKNEFVSILGQSGSGKTTCLNIIGGLDQYTSGDLKINGKSTKDFRQVDWDAYRNNSIGFIFQSYNLVSHLSLLENVELGMTLSGVSARERKKRALEVLDNVGLKEHTHKKPNQLSGGQMQRVAIARALANDPDIILADEPTGALDTETSEQIMELIKSIAKEKLVIMVTHNAELAEQYSNRIVKFSDGHVIDDTNPYVENAIDNDYKIKKTSMSFLTALKLSGRNIITKKWRTSITAFASSVGIIGVALILALSNGFDKQIKDYERGALSNYPITISEGEAMSMNRSTPLRRNTGEKLEAYTNNETILQYDPNENVDIHKNILTDEYLDYINNMDETLLGGISTTRQVNMNILKSVYGIATNVSTNQVSFSTYPTKIGEDSTDYLKDYYDLLAGKYPEHKTDLILVVDEYNRVTKATLEALGINIAEDEFSFDQILNHPYKMILNDDYYVQSGQYFNVNGQVSDLSNLYNLEQAILLHIVGIIRLKEDANVSGLTPGIVYSDELARDFIADAQHSQIVLAQNQADYNVITGTLFAKEAVTGKNRTTSASRVETKERALKSLGASAIPNSISLYPINFDSKEKIVSYLDRWNENMSSEEKIEYTDMAAMITSMTSSIMDSITLVLIAFASISLIVSMLMIGIIIYVSVIERTKEIGVLRALGARKKDITRVFNAETFIIGTFSGVLGITITYLLTVPINKVIYSLSDLSNVAQLNPLHAVALVVISIILTMLGGFIPSKMAAKKDPVAALRSE